MRLVIAVFLLLALPAAANAQVGVTLPVSFLTNDPAITIGVTPPGTPFTCALAGAAPAPCTSPWRPAVTDDGEYHYDVVAGGVTFSGKFTLDRTPPAITITGGPEDGSAQATRDATFTFTVADAHLDHAWCSELDYALACDGTYEKHDLGPGTYTVLFGAVDKAGNETRVTRTFTVVKPTLIVDPPKPKDEGGVLSTTASSPTVRLSSTHNRRWTRLRSLTIRDVEAGTAVKATCKGSGCPKRALRITATKDSVSLAGLTGRKLKPGTVIKITLSAKGKVTRTFTITIRATRAPRIS